MIDQSGQIAEPDIFAPHAQFQQHVQAGDSRRTPAGGHHLDVGEPLARDGQRVRRSGTDDDGRAVLVVMEDRNFHTASAQVLDDEAVGGLDILQVDRTEGRLERADDVGQFHRVGFVHFDIETVDIGEFLEQDRLALHHRLRRQRPDIAEAQNGGAVRDHRDKVRPRGIAAGAGGVRLDVKTGFGDAGGIGEAEVAPVGERLGRADLQFSGLGKLVIVERRLTGQILPRVVLPAVVHAILPQVVQC